MRRAPVVLLIAFACVLVGSVPAAAAPARWAPPLPRPLTVVRGFDDPPPYAPGHRGVDLAASAGAAVQSPGPGTVRFAGPVAGRPVVSVDSDGLRFSYEPVLPRVRAGQHVEAGTVLGVLTGGHPGCRAPPGLACLHWGLRLGTRYLDPLRSLHVRVRLLPLEDGTRRVAEEKPQPFPPSGPVGPLAALTLGVGVLVLRGRGG